MTRKTDMTKRYFVYLLSNKKNGTLYIGITNDLVRRVYEHKSKHVEGFSKKYNLSRLVWFDETSDVNAAIEKEKQMKKWKRAWKVGLIEEANPSWRDLYFDLV